MTRMILQYFFMVLKSSSILFLPSSSPHLLLALVKAFFFDLHLYVQDQGINEKGNKMADPHEGLTTQRRISADNMEMLDK